MNQKTYWLAAKSALALAYLYAGCGSSGLEPGEEVVSFKVPVNFPEPVYSFENNPVTQAGFELGRALFYDPMLSRDGSVSCGNCHQQPSGFTQHGHDLSHGIDDQLTLRNAQPIMNLAWAKEFGWDGGVFHLDLFAVVPIEAENEMGERLGNVLGKLQASEKYPPMFERAFGTREISTADFLKALSQFQLMCVSSNSRYDRYVRGEGESLNALELEGLTVFGQKCAGCHKGELFTDNTFRNNGLPVGNAEDRGRGDITLNPDDAYTFKVPSLRNVEATRPYMHDGRFRSLERVLDHYSEGMVDSPTLDVAFRQPDGNLGIPLSDPEKKAIAAFLKTLTDETFLTDRKLSEFF